MKPLAFALALALALPTVATAQTNPAPATSVVAPASASSSAAAHARHHKTLMGILKGGGIGCAVGGVFGLLSHRNPIKSCLVAGAAGAVVGGVVAYKHEVKQARALADATRQAGGSAQLQTQTVNAKADDGSTQQTEAMKALTLTLPASGVEHHDDATKQVLAQAADLAKSAQKPVVITVYGTPEQQDWMTAQLRDAYPDARIDSRNGDSPKLVLQA